MPKSSSLSVVAGRMRTLGNVRGLRRSCTHLAPQANNLEMTTYRYRFYFGVGGAPVGQ